jgi:nucleoside-diphosphate-sugar epimerase
VAKSRKSKALVTGAAGFLGFHLCKKLFEAGYSVVGVDDISTGLKSNANDLSKYGTKFVKADVSKNWDGWTKKIKSDLAGNFDLVFHFASPASPPLYQKVPLKTLAVNSLGLYRALDFATKKKARLVFASTSEIYGSPNVSPQNESYWGNTNSYGPRSCYDEAKRFGEALIYSYNQENKTKHGLVRIFNTYGPRMNPTDGRVIINFLMQMKKKKPLTVHGEGTQTRSFCYVDDLIDGIFKYAQKKQITQPVNLGNPREFTILELAKIVQNLGASPLEIKHVDRPVDDPPQRKPDLSLANSLLDWSPKISLEEGLKKVLATL